MNEQAAGLDPKPCEKLRVFTGSLYRKQNNRQGPVVFIENKPDTPTDLRLGNCKYLNSSGRLKKIVVATTVSHHNCYFSVSCSDGDCK